MNAAPWTVFVLALAVAGTAAAQAVWQPLGGFTSRRGAAVAYDTLRGETVIFGGDDGRLLAETWVWNGSSLELRTPPVSPAARAGALMAYDSLRQRVVMYGGLPETWAWDGTSWTQLTVTGQPPLTSTYRSMTYDPVHDRVLWWGGDAATTGQLWQFDGTDWSPTASVAPWPPAQSTSITFDADQGDVALYTTFGSQGIMWRWNGSAWSQQTGPALTQHVGGVMVHDPVGHRLLLAGGTTFGVPHTLYGWQPATASWTPLASGGPATTNHDALFDTARGALVVVGGTGLGTEADTSVWEWSGGPWQRRTFAPPFARVGHAMAYDRLGDRVFLFGSGSTYGDLWVRENGDWRLLVPNQASSASHPGGLHDERLVYDEARAELLLYGSTATPSCWRLAGTAWQQVDITPLGDRDAPGLVYDPVAQRTLLFGGGPSPAFNDTWSWDGATWTPLVTPTLPPARSNPGMAYDRRRQRVVMVGGAAVAGALGETWEFDGVDWELRASGSPVQPFASTLAWDEARQVVVAFVRTSNQPMRTWQWDGSTWSELVTGVPPAARPGVAIVGTRDEVLAFGGALGPNGRYSDFLSLRTPALAGADAFGASGSTGAGPLVLAHEGLLPWLGSTFGVALAPLPAVALPGLWAGGSRTEWLGTPLPLDLGPLGWAGSAIRVAPEIPIAMLLLGATATAQFPLPSTPSLAGAELHLQGFLLEPQGGVVTTSNGLTLTLGLR